MEYQIRTAAEKDISSMFHLWNTCYPHDAVDERRFRYVLFEDPEQNPSSTLLIEDEAGAVLGFSSIVFSKEDADKVGHLKAFAADMNQKELATELLFHAEKYASSEGATVIRIVKYTGDHCFFPGIDKRYPELISFFVEHGYEETEETKDMMIDLKNFSLNDQSLQKLADLEQKGIRIVEYKDGMNEALQTFRSQTENPAWFNGWSLNNKPAQGALAAMDEDLIVGFCEYRVSADEGSFGPLEVLMDYRDKKIGSALLLRAMVAMQKRGATRCTAKWVWPARLYESNGWTTERAYTILEKRLLPRGES